MYIVLSSLIFVFCLHISSFAMMPPILPTFQFPQIQFYWTWLEDDFQWQFVMSKIFVFCFHFWIEVHFVHKCQLAISTLEAIYFISLSVWLIYLYQFISLSSLSLSNVRPRLSAPRLCINTRPCIYVPHPCHFHKSNF